MQNLDRLIDQITDCFSFGLVLTIFNQEAYVCIMMVIMQIIAMILCNLGSVLQPTWREWIHVNAHTQGHNYLIGAKQSP